MKKKVKIEEYNGYRWRKTYIKNGFYRAIIGEKIAKLRQKTDSQAQKSKSDKVGV